MEKYFKVMLLAAMGAAAWGTIYGDQASRSGDSHPRTLAQTAPAKVKTGFLSAGTGQETDKSILNKSKRVSQGNGLPEALFEQYFYMNYFFDQCTVINANNDDFEWASAAHLECARLYTYGNNKSDDWLITPDFTLEAGKYYYVSAEFATSENCSERIEVKIGDAPTAEAMTTDVVPPTEFLATVDNPKEMGSWITVPVTGKYHVGVHGISDPDCFAIYLNAIKVETGVDGNAPSCATNLTATPDADFNPVVTISGNAPSKTANGDVLSSIESLEIYRDAEKVADIEVAPGAQFSFVDTAEEEGRYTYTVQAFNDAGRGMWAKSSVYAGVNVAAVPQNIVITELKDEKLGLVRATWDEVTTDEDGRPLPSDFINYLVWDISPNNMNVVDSKYPSNTIDWQSCPEDDQQFCRLSVRSITKGGYSNPGYSEMITIGKPYSLPYAESFDNGENETIVGWRTINGAVQWGLSSDGTDVARDADGTNGCVGFWTNKDGYASILHTGKLDLTTAKAPSFRFSLYNLVENGIANNNEIDVMVRLDGDDLDKWTSIMHSTVSELCKNGENEWQQIKADLSAYVGKVIHVGICITERNYEYAFVDALKVSEQVADNLSVMNFYASQTSAHSNEAVRFSVKVQNNADNEVNDYKVALCRYDSNSPIQVVAGPSLVPDAAASVTFDQALTFDDPTFVDFYAEILYDADKDPSDNISSVITIDKLVSPMPAPVNLTVENSNGRALLNWTSPSEGKPEFESVTEDFESYPGFSANIGQWTLYDGDRSPIGGFDGITMPNGISGTNQAFFLFDAGNPVVADSRYAQSFEAYSGNKYIATMYREDFGQLDDWIISPFLSGNEQTIKFYAKSYIPDFLETFEVLSSAEGTDPADFTSVAVQESVPAEWTEFSYTLPSGTKHFAIRANAENSFFFQVDDITYESKTIHPVGYNVYRNSVKVNAAPLTETVFFDSEAPAGSAGYRVTAVYESGEESEPSNEVSFTSAVDMLADGIAVTVEGNEIVVAGAAGKNVVVTNAAGMLLYRGNGSDAICVKAAPGIYIVNVGASVCKLMVR